MFVAFIAFYCILITAGVVTDFLGRNGQHPCYTNADGIFSAFPKLYSFVYTKTLY